MSQLITMQEMKDLTGAERGSKQAEILRKNGIRFTERADGRPVLTWESYNQQLLNKDSKTQTHGEVFSMPNLRAV